jgi:cephalosporin hydroxylase
MPLTLRQRLNPRRYPRATAVDDRRPSYHSPGLDEDRISAHPAVRVALHGYRRTVGRVVNRLFQLDLMVTTRNFDDVTWLGRPVWQNVLDLWVIQEAMSEIRPGVLLETGTNRGGSALFYASLMDLLDHGHVFTADVERMHDYEHPRVSFHIGSSTAPETLAAARAAIDEHGGPVMVILDSDHSAQHVADELEAYAPLVSPGGLMLVQDGIIDEVITGRAHRPGPLPAIQAFLARHPEFTVDERLNERFLITHHPAGWLRRSAADADHPAGSAQAGIAHVN